ncbi:hypothetical protein BDK51DRAFT_30937 [Blyttiomyces helicus]|uniref:SNRNP25 ubiquitin-like domain-containing protein n=1 Tax=Blyttiomyces helicus TaxID=388810 RepID=A0A4P9WHV4_9FUNG|nr:hypothetical protein BDK51DRAFT_30937 [Blyttiomyces helicus]|eukprot:RKO92419.1 hypothetical protein BDK51DRAFT_30937 [Blyttiomyces helicus]
MSPQPQKSTQDPSALDALLTDPLLSDLPPNPTLEEVEALIALESGDAFAIRIDRGPLVPLLPSNQSDLPLPKQPAQPPSPSPLLPPLSLHTDITLRHNATQRELKRLVRLSVQRASPPRLLISWRSFWRRHRLAVVGDPSVKLGSDDAARVVDAGVRPGAVLKFVRVLRPRRGRSGNAR